MRSFQSAATRVRENHVVRFLVVGVANTAFSYLVYAILVFCGLGYQLANLLALIIGILFSFKTQGRFVFNNIDNRRLWRFVASWALIYFCTIAAIGQFIAWGADPYSAGALALPLSTTLSYLTQKYFVFRPSDAGGREET